MTLARRRGPERYGALVALRWDRGDDRYAERGRQLLYFNDVSNQAGFLIMVGREIEKLGGSGVRLRDAVWAVADAAFQAGTMFGDEAEVEAFVADASGEIYDSASIEGLLSTSYDHGTGDSLDLLDFGDGMTYLGFDRNEDRGNDATIVGGIDPSDAREVSRCAADEMFNGLGATEMMLPNEINCGEGVREEDVRFAFTRSIGSGSMEPLGIPAEADDGVRRGVIAAYVNVALGGFGWDEGPGMLLSELLGLDEQSIAAGLDRVEGELRRLREELGDSGAP